MVNESKPAMSLEDLERDIEQDPLGTLGRLQLWQLAAVPFGNLVIHYSPHHTVSLDTEALFIKIVQRRMGGYCMENNTFFATILRSLGYELYTTGARVSFAVDAGEKDHQGYSGWAHMLNIITVHGRRYMVDVGFGTSTAIQPIHLKDGEMVPNVPPYQSRLMYKPIAPFTDSDQRMWIFEVRSGPESSWTAQYCFSELEFLPEDFAQMNYYTSQSPDSWFTRILVLTKFLLDKHQNKPVGNLTLSSNKLKRRLHGQSETLMTCATEEERVDILKEHFGVELRPDEIESIHGLPSRIKLLSEGS